MLFLAFVTMFHQIYEYETMRTLPHVTLSFSINADEIFNFIFSVESTLVDVILRQMQKIHSIHLVVNNASNNLILFSFNFCLCLIKMKGAQ